MSNLKNIITTMAPDIIDCIRRALAEDIGSGDVTTLSIVPPDAVMTGQIIAKQAGIVAGLDVAAASCFLLEQDAHFNTKDGSGIQLEFDACVGEGAQVENRQVLARVSGTARILLTAERTAMNFLGRMSGIATMTRQYVDAVAGTHAKILDTRKTVPGLRTLDKLAVHRGGGKNHRIGLFDMILIKDNHIDFAGSLEEAVRRARSASSGLEIEVEARTLDDVRCALELGVSRILLDNMSPVMMQQAVELTAGRALLEASGNVDLTNLRQIALTGVDFISSGALTHSVKVFDASFIWVK
jgi:nicotinate-nucleotide pyrophosphorylase (carboxylating)